MTLIYGFTVIKLAAYFKEYFLLSQVLSNVATTYIIVYNLSDLKSGLELSGQV